MQRIIAKHDLWIAVIAFKDRNEVFVHAGKHIPAQWLIIGDEDQFIQLRSGDILTFKAIADGDNPYQTLVEQYPDYFERG